MSIVMPVIVGAGPAGIRAAQTLAAQGLRPVILDEGLRPGGQIYRQPPPGFKRPKSALYGFEHRKADAVHRVMDALQARWNTAPGAWCGTPKARRWTCCAMGSAPRCPTPT